MTLSTCGRCLKPYDLSRQTQVCPHPKRTVQTQNDQVLDYLRRHPGATAHEVENGCYPVVSNPRARMSDLRKRGYVVEKVDRGGRMTGFRIVDPKPVTAGEQMALL